MHPEIRRDAPGACPICGMALEPLAPSAEEGESYELKDMIRRFWIGVALTTHRRRRRHGTSRGSRSVGGGKRASLTESEAVTPHAMLE